MCPTAHQLPHPESLSAQAGLGDGSSSTCGSASYRLSLGQVTQPLPHILIGGGSDNPECLLGGYTDSHELGGACMSSQEPSLHLALETVLLCSTWPLIQATVTSLVQHCPPLSWCVVSHSVSSHGRGPWRVLGVFLGVCASSPDLVP